MLKVRFVVSSRIVPTLFWNSENGLLNILFQSNRELEGKNDRCEITSSNIASYRDSADLEEETNRRFRPHAVYLALCQIRSCISIYIWRCQMGSGKLGAKKLSLIFMGLYLIQCSLQRQSYSGKATSQYLGFFRLLSMHPTPRLDNNEGS